MNRSPQRRCLCADAAVGRLFPARDYITGDAFEIVQCARCRLAFTEPVPRDWSRYYPEFYYGKPGANRFPPAVEGLQNRLYASRARRVQKLTGGKPGRVLDIGCGRGFLLRAFQRRGWEVTGTEMSESAAAYARQQLKLPVHVGALADLQLSEASFDAVVMWHVLEHFEDGNETLCEVHRLLRPGGVFLVAVPNFGSLEARLTRDKWFHLDVPRHLTHFSRATLTKALTEIGFRIESVSCRSVEYDFFSATQSTLNRMGLKHNWLYNVLRGGRISVAPLIGHALCLPLAVIPGVGAVLLGGSTVVIYAQKI